MRKMLAIPLVVAMGILIALPIKIGTDANKDIPVIGYVESISAEYCNETLLHAIELYTVVRLIDAIVGTVQSTTISLQPFGVGLSVSPGMLLNAAEDALNRVQTALFIIITTTLVGKLTIGLLSFVCIKILLPAALFLKILNIIFPTVFYFTKNIVKSLITIAVLVLVAFPLSAASSLYVKSAYTDSIYTNEMVEIGVGKGEIEKLNTEINNNSTELKDLEDYEKKSFFGKLKDTVTGLSFTSIKDAIFAKVNSVIGYVNDISTRATHIIAIFLINTLVIPLAVLFVCYNLAKAAVRSVASLPAK